MSDWWKFDGPDDEQDTELAALEKQALDAVIAIAQRADTHPDTTLVIGATLRKISTVSGSRAQTLSLRTASIRRKAPV